MIFVPLTRFFLTLLLFVSTIGLRAQGGQPVITVNDKLDGGQPATGSAAFNKINKVNNITAAGFTAPDTVCVNTPVDLINTSTGASSYFWNFCAASLNTSPIATNIGNPGNLNGPVFIDYAFYNGNYYGFVTNYNGGNLVRLDFGNSLLNTPVSVNLGNFGGSLPSGVGSEGIQVIHNENRWYAIIVGGWTGTGSTPRIVKIDFGPALNNPAPVATNWGNIGGMSMPVDLHVFKENNNWYGFTVNAENNTITRFNFTSSFNNTPTGQNLGNIGNLQYPTGIFAIYDNTSWRVFVVNAGNNSRTSPNNSISRLDFGSSLLNTPTGVNLGNPGNFLQHPRDITIMKGCNEIIGFVVNGPLSGSSLLRLNFNNNLAAVPTVNSLGNAGNLNFPHSISKLFRVQNDVYGLITNVADNTITRLRFTGCSNSNVQNTNAANPAPVVYNTPGNYNITLSIDDGLATQSSFCKQVVVLPAIVHQPLKTYTLCSGDSIRIGIPNPGIATSRTWSTGENELDSITVKMPGTYWITTNRKGCTNRDSFVVNVIARPSVSIRPDTNICLGSSIVLTTQAANGNVFNWSPAAGLSQTNIQNPIATPVSPVKYLLTYSNLGCQVKDSISIGIDIPPAFDLGAERGFCEGDSILLDAGSGGSSYTWQDGSSAPQYKVKDWGGQFHVTVRVGVCSVADTVNIIRSLMPVLTMLPDTALCKGGNITLTTQVVNGNIFSWSPATGLSDAAISSPVASPVAPVRYILTATNGTCTTKDSIDLTVDEPPAVNLGPDRFFCEGDTLRLDAFNQGASYQWQDGYTGPQYAAYLQGRYEVMARRGVCLIRDTVQLSRTDLPVFNLAPDTSACKGMSITLKTNAVMPYQYSWSPSAGLSADNVATPVATVSDTIKYYVTVIAGAGCFRQDSIILNAVDIPVVDLGNDTSICTGQVLLLDAGNPTSDHVWDDGVFTQLRTVSLPGNYKVRVSKDGCSAVDSISISIPDPGNFKVSPITAAICIGDSVQLSSSGGAVYMWYRENQFLGSMDSVIMVHPINSARYRVAITDACGASDTLSVPVVVHALPSVVVSRSNDVSCRLPQAQLHASGGIQYQWLPANGLQDLQNANPTVQPTVSSWYTVIVKDMNGCIDRDSIQVLATFTDQSLFPVPNAFTPNADGRNDCFSIKGWPAITSFELNIFNRWGERVYHSKNIHDCWNGYHRGKFVSNEHFVYHIRAQSVCGPIVLTGTVLAIK